MIWRFEDFELDPAAVELRRAGEAVEVEPQVFSLLLLLVENAERVVSKDEIVEKVWDGRAVSDSAITSRLKSARRALGDDGKSQRFLRTVHGKGLRFVGEARAVVPAAARQAEARAGAAVPGTEATTRPSIAVLPLAALGADAGALPEALSYDLLSALARLRWLFVIARGSSFRFRGAGLDVREIGRALGVRYCLSGHLELSGASLRVSVELAETARGEIVWTESYAARVDDIHEVRERIVGSVVAALEIRIPLHEAERAKLVMPASLDAWSAYHLGLRHMFRFNRPDNAAATAMFEKALEKAPDFARAHAGLSFTHFQDAFLRYSGDWQKERLQARRHAERSVEIDALDPFANFTMGRSLWLDGELEASLPWLDRAIELSPSYAQGIYARGWTDTVAGRGIDGRRNVDTAMTLSPLDPLFYAMLGTRALSHVVQGEDEEAAVWAERAARAPGAHVLIAVIAAVAHTLHGDEARARAWAADARSRRPGLSQDDFFRSFPFDGAARARIAGAMRKTGL